MPSTRARAPKTLRAPHASCQHHGITDHYRPCWTAARDTWQQLAPCFGFGARDLRLGEPQRRKESAYVQASSALEGKPGYLGFDRSN